MQYIWVVLAGLTLVYILTDGFKFFMKPKPAQNNNVASVSKANIAQNTKSLSTSTSTSSASTAASKPESTTTAEKSQPQEITSFELDRDTLKKSAEIWSRCSKRDKSRGKELVCSTSRYCLNEFVEGGCINEEFRKTMYALSIIKAQDILPYDELHLDKAIESVEWPPKAKYNDK